VTIRMAVFDLDGTLAESKSEISREMADLLAALSMHMSVCVITGGSWTQIRVQVLPRLAQSDADSSKFHMMPVGGAEHWIMTREWECISQSPITDKSRVLSVASQAASIFRDSDLIWGDIVEDRGCQVTLSMLGQEAPLSEKKSYDPHRVRRERIQHWLQEHLPDHEIFIGGSTSLDIRTRGQSKASGIATLSEFTRVRPDEMVFVGDDLDDGGNDAPVKSTGCVWIRVRSPEDTRQIIRLILRSRS
jgi:phosphomannomutase